MIWRRSLSLGKPYPGENRAIYTVCTNTDEVSTFASLTPVGGISYRIQPGEENLIEEFDEIVRNIKVITN